MWTQHRNEAGVNWASDILFFADGNIAKVWRTAHWILNDDIIGIYGYDDGYMVFHVIGDSIELHYWGEEFAGAYERTPSFVDSQGSDFIVGRWDTGDLDEFHELRVAVFLADDRFAFGGEYMWRNYGTDEDEILVFWADDDQPTHHDFFMENGNLYLRLLVGMDELVFQKAYQ